MKCISYLSLFWIAFFSVDTLRAQSRAERKQLGEKARSVLQRAQNKQNAGYDISPAVPSLKVAQSGKNHQRADIAHKYLDQATQRLRDLPPPPTLPRETISVSADASVSGKKIPHLAGNIVVQDFSPDPRWDRFCKEIGPNLIQVKLFLDGLNPQHDNYAFSHPLEAWEKNITKIHQAGGKVMLHLRNIPSRLSLAPQANNDIHTGKGPMTKAGEKEWSVIIRDIVTRFSKNPETRFDYIQDLGEPNIGTNWVEPDNLTWKRPNNAKEFARHFANTLRSATAVDPRVKVGGPTLWFSVNDTLWWDAFLGHLAKEKLTPGFLSVHIYDANFGIWDWGVALAKEKMKQYGFEKVPLIMTEWNTRIGNHNLPKEVQHSHFNASHAIVGFHKILTTPGLDHTYFYLGPGRVAQKVRPGAAAHANSALLMIRNGELVPNTNYNAFRLFTKLRDAQEIPFEVNHPHLYTIAGKRKDEVLLLLTYYEHLKRDLEGKGFPYREPQWNKKLSVQVDIDNLPFQNYTVETYRIDRKHSNPYTLGTSGAELAAPTTHQGTGQQFSQKISLPLYGVVLLRLRKN